MFIYRITNTINGKVYIGLDGGSEFINKRWKNHLSAARNSSSTMAIHRAMRKHGIDNFVYEILEHHQDHESLKNAEISQITVHQSNDFAFGYNRTQGGDNNWWHNASENHKQRAKAAIGSSIKNFWKELSEKDRAFHSKKRTEIQKLIYTRDRQERMQQGKYSLDPTVLHQKYKKAGEATARVLAKEFEVTDPHGKKFRITNLRKFCRENDLSVENMRAVSKGKTRSHKNWVCASVINGEPIYHDLSDMRHFPREWIFKNPMGDTIIVTNLSQQCKENNLPYWSLTHLSEIRKREWNGWKLIDVKY